MTHAILVPLLPLLSVLIVIGGAPERLRQRAPLALVPLAAAFAMAVGLLVHVASVGPYVVRLYHPSSVTELVLPFGLLIDRVSALMMVLIALVGSLIFKYSITYMFQDPGYTRFLALIGVTTAVLLAMVASANLAMLFLCWQLLSYLLYLLAHNLGHGPTRAAAVRTFRSLRLGDAAFLGAVALAYRLYGTLEFHELFARAQASPMLLSLGAGFTIAGPTAVALLLFAGVMSKSAQFPLHPWLPGSLYAPTPVSALLHAGLINAGGFLMNRLAPLYALSPVALHVALAVGGITMFVGAATMLTQNDIKKTLGYSTIGQMGYMVMECGLGAFALAMFHLIAHGLFKAAVFLDCGSVVHQAREEPALPPPAHYLEGPEFSPVSWTTGLFTTLLMPLAILLLAHGVLEIPLLDSQSTVIFLYFMWVTSAQALLTLTRLQAVASWKVAATMLATLLALVFTYLFAAESFTRFLYPDAAQVSGFFRAAALPTGIFDVCVVLTTALTLVGWARVYARARGGRFRLPAAMDGLLAWLYVVLMHNLLIERVYAVDEERDGGETAAARLTLPAALVMHAALGLIPLAVFAAVGTMQSAAAVATVSVSIVGAWLVASFALLANPRPLAW